MQNKKPPPRVAQNPAEPAATGNFIEMTIDWEWIERYVAAEMKRQAPAADEPLPQRPELKVIKGGKP